MMTKILTATSALLMLSGAAFAQSTALDNTMPFEYKGDADASIVEFFADENGMMRADEDFNARVSAATPEQMSGLNDMCTEMQQDETLFLDTVQSRCKAIGDMM